MNLENKVVVVTGASQGLGKVLAQKVAKLGAKVALVARSKDKLEVLKQELGENAAYFVCDVSRFEEIEEAVVEIQEKFGTIDILINNAGIWTTNDIEEKNPKRREEALKINTLGTINFSLTVLPILQKKNSGYIFNVVSTSGASDIPEGDNQHWLSYGASKWALRGFSKDLFNKLRSTHIKVTAIFPGGMDTNIFENAGEKDAHNQSWMMNAEDVADIIVFCLTRPTDVAIESLVITKKM